MDDKHDPNGSVPIGTFQATSDDGDLEIPIEIVAEDVIEEQQLAITTSDDERPGGGPSSGGPLFGSNEPPRRQRVATLLGVPLPGSAVAGREAADPTRASRREISAAVDDALDERPTTIYGYKRDSLAELEHLVESEMTELPSYVDRADHTAEILGVVSRSSDTGTYEIEVHEVPDSRKSPLPVLAPAQFVEARARDARDQREQRDQRDQRDQHEQRDQPAAVVSSTKTLGSHDRARDGQPTAPIASRSDRKRDRIESEPPVKKPISSLAPMEVKRPRATQKQREPASAIGYALVAAMVLLGIGGWFLTSGGYRRSTDQAAQPTAAASVLRPADPLASAKTASIPEPTPAVAEPAPPVENAVPTPAPTPAEPGTSQPSRPRVASKTLKKSGAPAPAPAFGEIETPSRDDVLNGLDRVRSTVTACAEGRQGVAEVDLTIAANGIVTNALVGGDFRGTPQGSCIARAVRKARFPTFKADRYRVLFPYVL
jgi:hypothetical protein